ncbi:MAG: amidase family protein [Vicinamibacterales bacterium]
MDVTIPGLDEPLNASSLIALEFKTDLQRYLSAFPAAPVHSLQDILDRGDFHAALEATFKLRNAAEPDADEITAVEARRSMVTALVRGTLEEHRLDALAYPTLRRRPVVVEEPQRGTNCQLSATTGYPAMAMPAGFTDDGVPIGLELLGPAWSDHRLVSMAYAYERASHPRREPPTTPRLVRDAAPAPVSWTARADGAPAVPLTFDPVSGRLSWELPADVVAAAVHRGDPGPDGPVLHRLVDPASPAARGALVLPPYQRPWLAEGRLRLVIQQPAGRVTIRLQPPR